MSVPPVGGEPGKCCGPKVIPSSFRGYSDADASKYWRARGLPQWPNGSSARVGDYLQSNGSVLRVRWSVTERFASDARNTAVLPSRKSRTPDRYGLPQPDGGLPFPSFSTVADRRRPHGRGFVGAACRAAGSDQCDQGVQSSTHKVLLTSYFVVRPWVSNPEPAD
jgi:hypothetical protein